MTISLKADSSGTFGEVLVNGSPVLKVSNGLLELANGKDFFNQGNIVGTVSQSGGIPTGAVVERGNNASGSYVRFADGTQICLASLALYATAASNNYAIESKSHPAAFSAIPITVCVVSSTDSGSIQGAAQFWRNGPTTKSTTPTQLTVSGYTYYEAITQALTIGCISVGRWY